MASAGQHDGEAGAADMHKADGQAGHHKHERLTHRRGHHQRFKRALAQLDLSDAQKEEIKTMMESAHSDMQTLRSAARDNRKQMKMLAGEESLDLATAEDLAAAQGDLAAQMALHRVTTHHAILAVLSEVQRAELDSMRADRKAARAERRAARQG